MTDYRDPYRDPANPAYRDPNARMSDLNEPAGTAPWSTSTWGWIAGAAIAALVLIFAFGTDRTDVATDQTSPPASVGQRPAPPATGTVPDAPTAQPAPAPAAPAPQK